MAITTVDSTGNVGEYTSLAIVNGKPAIAYHDATNTSLKYAIADDVSGDVWSTLVTVDSTGQYPSLVVVNGKPAIAYYDNANLDLKYAISDDINGNVWSTFVTVDSTGQVGLFPSLAVINNKPAIAYYDNTNGDLKYAIADDISGNVWSTFVTVDSTGQYPSLVVVNGKPAIAYYDNANLDLKYAISDDINGNVWSTLVTVESTGQVGETPSLAVVNGKPAISYYNQANNNLKYAISDDINGNVWSTLVTVESPPFGGILGLYTSLAVVNGRPAISYWDQAGGSFPSNLKYARADDVNGNVWSTLVLVDATIDSVGQWTSLSVINGKPAISYHDVGNADLKYAIAEDIDGNDWQANESSSQSSSSSAPFTFTEQLNQIIAGNNPENLILFTYTPDDGFEYADDNQEIVFSFRTVNNEFFNYDSLLNPTAVEESEDDDCYVPEDDDVNIKHEPIFYVDLIVKNGGVKNTSVRAQEEKYKEEKVKYSFIIPKFTWDQNLITDAIASNVAYTPLDDATGSFWAGTDDDMLYKVEYSSNVAAEAYKTAEDGTIKEIIVNPTGQQMYVTTDEKLKKYTIDHYIDNADETQLFVTQNTSVDNEYKIMSEYGENILTALPELGTIQELDQDALTEILEVEGFDAPFKIVNSVYHNCIFIAGTNILWKYDGSITSVYSVEGYDISDFDVSDNGLLIIALNGISDSYLRILDRNLFRLLINERIVGGKARFCKSCSNQFLYGLAEIDSGGDQFVARHHMYSTLNGTYVKTESPNVLFKPDVEVADTPATQPVEIEYPNGSENVLIGGELEILWKSTKSVGDSVKIELYKDEVFLRTITASTPNTGIFAWSVPATLDIASDYKIRMEWLAAEVNPANEDFSDATFSMTDVFPSSSETDIDYFGAIGVDYDKQNDQVVIVLESGLVGFLRFEDFSFQGWIDSGITNFTAMVVKNENIKKIGTVSKVRIFVGSQLYLSDRWDSKVVETGLNSIYYGGGDNLVPGETYYVNIQVYSEDSGWSEVQTKKWIMPKN